MVKGQCKIHFLPFVCCIVLLWYLTFELCSTAPPPQTPTPLSVYLSSVSLLYWIWNLLDSCSSLPFSVSALCHPSISFIPWPSLYLDISATGRSFSLFFFVFLCSPLPFDQGVHDSMTLFGVCSLSSHLNALTKALSVFFRLFVCLISALFSLLVECDSLLWQNPKHQCRYSHCSWDTAEDHTYSRRGECFSQFVCDMGVGVGDTHLFSNLF